MNSTNIFFIHSTFFLFRFLSRSCFLMTCRVKFTVIECFSSSLLAGCYKTFTSMQGLRKT